MKQYEIVVLLHPDLEIDLDKPLKKIESIITAQKGKVTKQDVWGKRKLAYTIAKQEFAVYVYYEVDLPPESVRKVETALNITDEIIRYLITHPVPEVEDEKPDDGAAGDEEDAESDRQSAKRTAKSSKTKDEE